MGSMINTNSNTNHGGDLYEAGKNIGELDSLVCLGLGFSMLGYGITKVKLCNTDGLLKIAEGITRVSIITIC